MNNRNSNQMEYDTIDNLLKLNKRKRDCFESFAKTAKARIAFYEKKKIQHESPLNECIKGNIQANIETFQKELEQAINIIAKADMLIEFLETQDKDAVGRFYNIDIF